MIHFSVYNKEDMIQDAAFFPLFISTAKLVGAFATEVATVYFMMRDKTVNGVIGSFVAFSIVSKIDNIMALTLTNVDIGGEIGAKPIKFNSRSKIYDDFKLLKKWFHDKDMNIIQWVFMLMYMMFSRTLRFLYVTIYFYFTPIAVVAFVEYSAYTIHR